MSTGNADNPSAYPGPVWRRFRAPSHAATGEPRAGQIVVMAISPAARLELSLVVVLDGPRIRHCRFLAYGCPFTIAVGDWLAQWCEGQNLEAISQFCPDELRDALEIPEERAHCVLMAQDLLRDLKVKAT